ncbi:TIGR03643 family protein [Pelagibacteraceae bacterium]|nr:TIGR03643 family protein [Pelagibacteraceae bacterium]
MKKINKLEALSQAEIDRIIEMGWEDRTTFEDIRVQFDLLEKEVIALMKANLKRTSFLNWRKRVRGRKTKIENVSDRFKSKKQKN